MKTKSILSLFITVFTIGLLPKEVLAAPCTGLPSLTRNITNEVCSIQAVVGVDNAINIETSRSNGAPLELHNASITINPEAALVFGSLSIGDNVTIALAEGGQMLSGQPLYVEDKDADGWPSSFSIFTSTTSGRRRLSLMKSFTEIDCDDTANTGYDPLNMSGPWFRDLDGDGKGTASITQTGCVPPAGYITDNTDCNDGSAEVWLSHAACYADLDGDGFAGGTSASATCLNNASCNSATRASASTNGAAVTTYTAGRLLNTAPATADCNDTSPNAQYVMYGGFSCFLDTDNDNYGNVLTRTCFNTQSCATATWGSTGSANDVVNINFASNSTDCYDGDPVSTNAELAYPGSTACLGAHRGDGSFDYNCVSGPTKCGTIYNHNAYLSTWSGQHGTGSCKNNNADCRPTSTNYYAPNAGVGCGATGAVCTANIWSEEGCGDCGDSPDSRWRCGTVSAGPQTCQ